MNVWNRHFGLIIIVRGGKQPSVVFRVAQPVKYMYIVWLINQSANYPSYTSGEPWSMGDVGASISLTNRNVEWCMHIGAEKFSLKIFDRIGPPWPSPNSISHINEMPHQTLNPMSIRRACNEGQLMPQSINGLSLPLSLIFMESIMKSLQKPTWLDR